MFQTTNLIVIYSVAHSKLPLKKVIMFLIMMMVNSKVVQSLTGIHIRNDIADGIKELVDVAKSAEKIIVATGSLTTKYEAARAQLDEFISESQTANLGKRLFWLVNSSGKKVHPLAIRNEPWGFGPISKMDLVVKEVRAENE